jgi:hypothetical protein
VGGDAFIERLHKWAPKDADLDEVPRIERRPLAKPLSGHEASGKGDREVAIVETLRMGDYTMKQRAEHSE